ncbi:uncharacterized protein [Henckelia pumila]|uniref:uncharacterized protein n=1 Tax=Henckelia pumila TaxID=405737 RepID=UPI003C6DE705
MVKWVVELSQYGIEYRPHPAIKAQILADFIVEMTVNQEEISTPTWMVYVDGSSTSTKSGAGAKILTIHSDYQLIVSQVNENYEAKEDKILGYFTQVNELLSRLDSYDVKQIPRVENESADCHAKLSSSLANIDNRKITFLTYGREETDGSNVTILCVDSEEPCWKDEIVDYLMRDNLPANQVEARKLKVRAVRFTIIDGELYKRSFSSPYLKCLTSAKGNYVLREIHEKICGNHLAGRALAEKTLRQEYFWPTMNQDAIEFGIPKTLISDNGTQFYGAKIKDWCKELSIKQFFTSVGNPQANGQTEVTNRTILQQLKTRLGNAKGKWVDELPSVLWAYRITPRSSTGESFFNLAYEAKAVGPAEGESNHSE